MESYKKLIGKKIQKRRIEKGFSNQTALADKLGVDQPQITKWETGVHLPEGKHKKELSKLLDVKDDFFELIEIAPETKEHLIGDIVTLLPALNEPQLRNILAIASAHSGTTVNVRDSKVE